MKSSNLIRNLLWATVLLVIILIIGYITRDNIATRASNDDLREANLDNSQYMIDTYYRSSHKLPQELRIVASGNPLVEKMLLDPATKRLFEYKILPDKLLNGIKHPTYALCANFDDDGSVNNTTWIPAEHSEFVPPTMAGPQEVNIPAHTENTRFTHHPKGYYCFEISLDPISQ